MKYPNSPHISLTQTWLLFIVHILPWNTKWHDIGTKDNLFYLETLYIFISNLNYYQKVYNDTSSQGPSNNMNIQESNVGICKTNPSNRLRPLNRNSVIGSTKTTSTRCLLWTSLGPEYRWSTRTSPPPPGFEESFGVETEQQKTKRPEWLSLIRKSRESSSCFDKKQERKLLLISIEK